jgi:hypothetical protein
MMEDSMPPRKRGSTTLEASETKIGEAVPRAVIDTVNEVVGVSPQINPVEEIAEVRGQLETLRSQIADATAKIGSGARQAGRQAEASAKLYPMSSVLAVAGLAALFVLAVTGLRSAPSRSRSQQMLDGLQDLYDRTRGRF